MQSFKKYKSLISKVANQMVFFAKKSNVNIEFEDAFQNMSICFLKCSEKFDESKGFKFTTYFVVSARNYAHRWISREHTKDLGDADLGDEWSIEDIAIKTPSIEDELIFESKVAIIREKLDQTSRMYFDILVDPPIEILEEIRMRQQKQDGRQRSLNLNFADVSKIMGVKRTEGNRVRATIERACGRYLQ